jgi:hypothetical protein
MIEVKVKIDLHCIRNITMLVLMITYRYLERIKLIEKISLSKPAKH